MSSFSLYPESDSLFVCDVNVCARFKMSLTKNALSLCVLQFRYLHFNKIEKLAPGLLSDLPLLERL